MNEETLSVLVDAACHRSREITGMLADHGLRAGLTAGSPLRIQSDALRLKPGALILSSRTRHTAELCSTLKGSPRPPFVVLVCQSGFPADNHCADLTVDSDDPKLSEKLLSAVSGEHTPSRRLNISEETVADALFRLCMTKNYQGYRLALDAIRMACTPSDVPRCISKDIYPAVAKKHSVTPASVERNIRTAIHSAWTKAGSAVKREFFGTFAHDERWIPTNSQFIYIIADRLSLACQERV